MNGNDNDQLERLQAHNAQLLAELKAERQARKVAEKTAADAVAVAEGSASALEAERFEIPAQAAIEAVTVAAMPYAARLEVLKAAGVTVEKDDQGRPLFVAGSRKARPAELGAMLSELYATAEKGSDQHAIGWILPAGNSGGGAPGSRGGDIGASGPNSSGSSRAGHTKTYGLR